MVRKVSEQDLEITHALTAALRKRAEQAVAIYRDETNPEAQLHYLNHLVAASDALVAEAIRRLERQLALLAADARVKLETDRGRPLAIPLAEPAQAQAAIDAAGLRDD
jgi:hypothetical protein